MASPNQLENRMVQTDYSPMVWPHTPLYTCDMCGGGIWPGEKYLDIGDKLCAECLRKYTKEAEV